MFFYYTSRRMKIPNNGTSCDIVFIELSAQISSATNYTDFGGLKFTMPGFGEMSKQKNSTGKNKYSSLLNFMY
jgi:hypothetical protein